MGGKTFNQPIVDAINNVLKGQTEVITSNQEINSKITNLEKHLERLNEQLQLLTDEEIPLRDD